MWESGNKPNTVCRRMHDYKHISGYSVGVGAVSVCNINMSFKIHVHMVAGLEFMSTTAPNGALSCTMLPRTSLAGAGLPKTIPGLVKSWYLPISSENRFL